VSAIYISEEQVQEKLTYEALIPAIRQALVDYSAGRVEQPLRTILRVAPQHPVAGGDEANQPGWFAVMPAIAGAYLGVKTVTFFPVNSALGIPTHLATIELLRRATGEPLAVMDGRLITEMRTAAVSAVAVEALTRPGARTLGLLGSGVQARSHAAALRQVWPAFREPGSVRVWSRNAQKAAAVAEEIGAVAVSIEEAAGCDVVVTVTSSPTPVLRGAWLKADSLVVAVGAVGKHLRELDDEVMRGCLIAESRQGSENESGDVILSGAKVFVELGEVLAGNAPAIPAGRRVFKSLGMAIEDVTAARLVWEALQGSQR
jgi:thiomorpholine-carboxylate dehydrogenase